MPAFGDNQFENYQKEVKEKWGSTDAYKEYCKKSKDCSDNKFSAPGEGVDSIMDEFACCMKDGNSSSSDAAQMLCRKLQSYITENLYSCTKVILAGLGRMYICDERFRNNINKHGEGTAEYISEAIEIYCK